MDILDDMGVNYQQKFFFLKVNYSFKQQKLSLTLIIMSNQHIKMISEGLCDIMMLKIQLCYHNILNFKIHYNKKQIF